ncbi:ZIP family metal transporter [Candidatus Micrarchaeota archaeon]|nr:ZIP family metal transporter [Candidatus Micrarchaeota archaeon]
MKLHDLFYGILPVVLLAGLIWVFLAFGPLGLLKTGFPPVESISFEKLTLGKDVIMVEIINDGPDPVTISQVIVNDAYNKFEISQKTLNHLEKASIRIEYPWSEGLPLKVTLLTEDGLRFEKEIAVAIETPAFNFTYVTTFALLGIYVGVMPVFLGLLWLPFLRTLSRKWYDFFLSLTVGLLVFLAVDAFGGALELSGEVAIAFQGVALIVIGFFLSLFTLTAISERGSIDVTKKGVVGHALRLSYMIALGIGIHNLGEGLAIGSAYSIGEIALGSLLVIGFMMHNLTEGIAIVAPIAREKEGEIKHLIQLGLIAGGPTIIGAWVGGFAFSNLSALFFLAVGAGAILHVVIEITKHMKKESSQTIFTFTNILGFFIGLLIMYVTGLFVF